MRRSIRIVLRSVSIAALALASVAAAGDIQKWRAPDGSIYFGDRPPTGSTLVETYAESPKPPVTVLPNETATLSEAAAEGRDIIRRREQERAEVARAAEAREAEIAAAIAAAEAVEAYRDREPTWFIINTQPPCRYGERCGGGHPGHHRHDWQPGRPWTDNGGGFHQPSRPPLPIVRPDPRPRIPPPMPGSSALMPNRRSQ